MEWVEAGGGLNNSNFRGRVDSSRLDFVSLCSLSSFLCWELLFLFLSYTSKCAYFMTVIFCVASISIICVNLLRSESVYIHKEKSCRSRVCIPARESKVMGWKFKLKLALKLKSLNHCFFTLSVELFNFYARFSTREEGGKLMMEFHIYERNCARSPAK